MYSVIYTKLSVFAPHLPFKALVGVGGGGRREGASGGGGGGRGPQTPNNRNLHEFLANKECGGGLRAKLLLLLEIVYSSHNLEAVLFMKLSALPLLQSLHLLYVRILYLFLH